MNLGTSTQRPSRFAISNVATYAVRSGREVLMYDLYCICIGAKICRKMVNSIDPNAVYKINVVH